MRHVMTPEEAQLKYDQKWPLLNSEKLKAICRNDKIMAKRYRQRLSALSMECAARHELSRDIAAEEEAKKYLEDVSTLLMKMTVAYIEGDYKQALMCRDDLVNFLNNSTLGGI